MEFRSTVPTGPRAAVNDGQSGDNWAKPAVLAPLPPLSVPSAIAPGAECAIAVSTRGQNENGFDIPTAGNFSAHALPLIQDTVNGRALRSNPAGRGLPVDSNGKML